MKLVDKTYSFYSDYINIGKYDILLKKANALLKYKNEISEEICLNPNKYMNLSKFEWINELRKQISYCNNQDIAHAISDVYVSFDNKRVSLNKSSSAKIQNSLNIVLYKKNHSIHKKGDLRSFNIKLKSTDLSKTITYLTRYYNEGLIPYLKNNISEDISKQEFREMILFYINKYGDRLINLAVNRQKRIEKKIFKHRIEFESLAFTSCTEQKQNIINRNPNTQSKYNTFITLPGQKTKDGKIHIPIKFSNKHHGSLKHYYKEPNKKNQRNTSYTIVFSNKNKIRILLTRKKEDKIIAHKTNIYGIDVNVKHNLFCDKYNNTIDFDRKIFNAYVKFLLKCDKKIKFKKNFKNNIIDKKERENYKIELSNRDKKEKNKWIIRIKDMLKRKSNQLVKQAIKLGKDHIVMEDLQLMARSFVKSKDIESFKYSRLIRLLNLADLKNIVTSIANKHGLQVTFIQAPYTSQTCKCGNITKSNRVTQEMFKCVNCGLTSNADAHSSDMIEERLSLDVLRTKLLIYENGLYTPKKLGKDSIKKILEECYDSYATQKHTLQKI